MSDEWWNLRVWDRELYLNLDVTSIHLKNIA